MIFVHLSRSPPSMQTWKSVQNNEISSINLITHLVIQKYEFLGFSIVTSNPRPAANENSSHENSNSALAMFTLRASRSVRSGNPSGQSQLRKGGGSPGKRRMSLAREAVPQTGAKCNQTKSGESNQHLRRSLSDSRVRSKVKMELRAFFSRSLSTAIDPCMPCCLATEQRTAAPAKTSIMKTCSMCSLLKSLNSRYVGGLQALCCTRLRGFWHLGSMQRRKPFGHRSPGLTLGCEHPAGVLYAKHKGSRSMIFSSKLRWHWWSFALSFRCSYGLHLGL